MPYAMLEKTFKTLEKDAQKELLDFAMYLAARQKVAAEKADDDFCERLYQDYLSDNDPEKDKEWTLEECKAKWGLS